MSRLTIATVAAAVIVLITTSISGVSALNHTTEKQTQTHEPLKTYKAFPGGKPFTLKEAKPLALFFSDSKEIARVSIGGKVRPGNVGTTRIRIVRFGEKTKTVAVKVAKKQTISAPQEINAV